MSRKLTVRGLLCRHGARAAGERQSAPLAACLVGADAVQTAGGEQVPQIIASVVPGKPGILVTDKKTARIQNFFSLYGETGTPSTHITTNSCSSILLPLLLASLPQCL